MNNKFTEEDKSKIVQYLNLVAASAEFKMKTSELIKYYQLLNFMQTQVLPKIEANILEVKNIIEAPSESSEENKVD